MAVSKKIVKCVPYENSSSKVDKWDIEMQYENDSEGDSTITLLLSVLLFHN